MLKRLAAVGILGLCAFGMTAGERQTYRNSSQSIAARPLSLDPDNPNRRMVGALQFLGAWQLSSDHENFGGFSALTRLADGRFLAISDAGWMAAFSAPDQPSAGRDFIAPMPEAFGKDKNYEDRDSESITHDPTTGQYWVGYEAKAAIRRFPASFARRDAIARPEEMQAWGFNSGAEAMVRLPDGRFLVFSEGHDRPDGSYEALIFSGDPTEGATSVEKFGYAPPAGYKITDAAGMADGRIITLNRRLALPSGFEISIGILDPAEIGKDKTVRAKEIARLISPLLVDNLEGIHVEDDGDNTVIWLISDNNFNLLQRNLLMKFLLRADRAAPAKKPAETVSPGFDALGS